MNLGVLGVPSPGAGGARFADDDEQKKTVLYYIALTYASQGLTDKAVEAYNTFQASYKGDPIAESLPLAIGGLFLNAKNNDPEKAISYFKEGLALYPKGRLVSNVITQQANAMVQLKRYDDAIKAYRDLLASHPQPEIAAQAEFGIGNIEKETGKLAEAIAQYKKVRDANPGTPLAEQSAFWVGHLSFQKGDLAAAVTELHAFLAKYPKSDLYPTAKFTLAQATLAKNDKAGALELFKAVSDDFPQSPAAPYAYFQRASIYAGNQKVDEMVALMKEFIAKYPQSDKIFFAYDTIGQSQVNTGKPLDAVATYGEMVEKNPTNPQAAAALFQVVHIWLNFAKSQGNFLALNEEQRTEWTKGVTNSVKAVEKLLTDYPKSPQVATALQDLLADQKLLLTAKVKTDDDLTKYFEGLARKQEEPGARSKILFTLAAFTYEQDKAKALQQMTAAYDPTLIYAPADIDLFGAALLQMGKVDESAAVYQKLANDFPIPAGVAPNKAAPQVQEAQAIALYGTGKALQKQHKIAEAGEKFDTLTKLYPWSPKILEANFGKAQALHEQKNDKDAIPLLVQIIRSPTGTPELLANSMLLLASIQEGKGEIAAAIDQYIKVSVFYDSVASASAEGLWKGAQLLEKQAAGLSDPPKPKEPSKSGQIAKAVRAYQDLVTKYPNSPHAGEAKARLAALPAAKK